MKRSLSMLVFAFVATVLCALTLPPAPAHAVLITLEPDDYAVGTNVTNLFEGVTITRYSHNFGSTQTYSTPVYVEQTVPPSATSYPLAATGTLSFGNFTNPAMVPATCWSGLSCSFSSTYDFSVMMIQFDQPTNFLEIAASWLADDPALTICGPTRQCTWASPSVTYLRPEYHRDGAATLLRVGDMDWNPYIQTVFIGGWSAGANIDRIQYNRVPEPSTLLLLGSGLFGLVAWRRKQTT